MLSSEQQQLVVKNMGLVSYVIKKYVTINHQSREYDLEDLHQVGYEGLCIAAMAYQSDKGATYWHFAEIVVRNHLYNYCRQINRQQIDIQLEAAEQVSAWITKARKILRQELLAS